MPRHSAEQKTYLSILFGGIREKVTKDTPGAVPRVNKNNDEVWERVDKSLEGKLVDIFYKEHHEYGNSYEIVIDDGDEKFNLSLHEDSKYAIQFLSRFPNINLKEFITIVPYEFTPADSDKKRSGLNIFQGDNKIADYFRVKEGENWIHRDGFPEPEAVMDKKKWKKYSIEVQEFLYEYFKTHIKPILTEESVKSHEYFPEKPEEKEEDDDLPF